MTLGDRWLSATWPVVRARLPSAPARIVDVGCGPDGGFVPHLRTEGYEATGIDPAAPDGPNYQRIEFERAELPEKVDAVIASASLHHVADPSEVVDRITSALTMGGVVIVVEWAWENFDEETARWCFERLRPDSEPGWLHRRRDDWLASGLAWSSHLGRWAEREQLHRSDELVRVLDARLERQLLAHGPYFFPDLAATSKADEQAAIDAGQIRACRVDYAGTLR